jgi:hypothetical protein
MLIVRHREEALAPKVILRKNLGATEGSALRGAAAGVTL